MKERNRERKSARERNTKRGKGQREGGGKRERVDEGSLYAQKSTRARVQNGRVGRVFVLVLVL